MVDIVQSNISKLLIRKIGYSVGLENTCSRLKAVVALFEKERQLTEPSWHDLVQTTFKRKLDSAKHFESLFAALNVFTVVNGRPVTHSTLDSCALLRRFFSDDPKAYDRAFNVVLLYALTIADGELFSALLGKKYTKGQTPRALTEFRRFKLSLFYQCYKNPADRNKLSQIIDFQEIDSSARAVKDISATSGPFAGIRAEENRQSEDFEVSLSDDWYRKIPPRRQSWAEDLGLFREGGVTAAGARYLEEMRKLSPPRRTSVDELGPVVLMPLDIEMRANHVTWALNDALLVKFDKVLDALWRTYCANSAETRISDDDSAQYLEMIAWALGEYTNADIRFHMLRRELPYTVFGLFLLGVCVAKGEEFPNLADTLEALTQKGEISLRPSRANIYGITLPKRRVVS